MYGPWQEHPWNLLAHGLVSFSPQVNSCTMCSFVCIQMDTPGLKSRLTSDPPQTIRTWLIFQDRIAWTFVQPPIQKLDSGKWLRQSMEADLSHLVRHSDIKSTQIGNRRQSLVSRWSDLPGPMGRERHGWKKLRINPQNHGVRVSSENVCWLDDDRKEEHYNKWDYFRNQRKEP